MADNLTQSINAYSNSGAALDPTTSLLASPDGEIQAPQGCNMMNLFIVLSGTALDNLEVTVGMLRADETVAGDGAAKMAAVNGVSSDVVDLGTGEADYKLTDAGALTGRYVLSIPVQPYYKYLVSMKRTGGDATSRALGTADFVAV